MRALFHRALPLLLSALLLGCGAGGIVGHGGTGTAPKAGIAGLTRAQEDFLRRGPGRVSLRALAELPANGATLRALVNVGPLRQSGLLEAILDRAPQDVRTHLDNLRTKSSVEPTQAIDGLGLWGEMDGVGSLQKLRLSVTSKKSTAVQLIGLLEALEEEIGDEPNQNENMDFEFILGADVPHGGLDAVIAATTKDVEKVQRINLSDRTAFVVADDGGELIYAYFWPHGALVGTQPRFTGNVKNAGAARIHAAIRRLDEAISSASAFPQSVPTLELKAVVADKPHHIVATIDSHVSLSWETAMEVFGPADTVRTFIESWESSREFVIKGIEAKAAQLGAPDLKTLLVDAIQNAEISETGDGVRIETHVGVSTLVDGIRDIPQF